MHDRTDLHGCWMAIVGKEQISQDGMVGLFCSTPSRSSTAPHQPRFVNNDYVTAEITFSPAHARHEVLVCLKVVCGYVMLCYAMLRCYATPRYVTLRYVTSSCVCCCGCCVSKERINVSEVPTVSRIFFQLLWLCLAYLSFNKQCWQWDTARQLASWTASATQVYLCSIN